MKLSKVLLIWTIFILCTTVVFAVCPGDPDCPPVELEFDYDSGNYKTIDWDNFNDWSKIPPNRIPDIPTDKLDYSQLNTAQRLEMTVEQIALNLDRIDNLAVDVKEDRAREAIKKNYQVTVLSLGRDTKIVNNVLRAEFGEHDSFDLNGKQTWKLEIVVDGRIEVLEPREITEQKISQQDSFTLVTETRFTSTSGYVTTVKDLSFKNGQAYVRLGDEAEIGDYYLSARNDRVDVFFNPATKPTGNYLAISDNGLNVGSTPGNAVRVIPLSGNELFNMVKRDYSTDPPDLVPSERDTLVIIVSNGDGLEIITRADSGKTPLFKHHDGNGETIIETGRMIIGVKDRDLKVVPPEAFSPELSEPIDLRNSVAFEFSSDSPEIKQILRTSSSNRFVLLENDQIILGNNLGLRVSDKIEPNMIKTINDLQQRYPAFNFEKLVSANYDDITANMAQTVDEWLEDKPGLEKYVQEIQFNLELNAFGGLLHMGFGERIVDSATLVKYPIRDVRNPLEVFDHELVHALDKYVNDKEKDIIDKLLINSEEYQKERQEISGKNILTELTELRRKHLEKNNIITLQSLYDEASISLADQLLSDKEFLGLLEKIGTIELVEKFFTANARTRARVINSLGFDLEKTIYEEEKHFSKIYNNLIKARTGMYPYTFKISLLTDEFREVSSTYSELPPERARRSGQLAQLEYDRVMSLDPPPWMRQQAEDRYYEIMGGREGSFCQTSPCGPCLIYTLTCKKE